MYNAFIIASEKRARDTRDVRPLSPRLIVTSILLALAQGTAAASSSTNEVSFNTRFGGLAEGRYDVGRLARGAAPGVYRVDVYVNGEMKERQDVEFRDSESDEQLMPCLDEELLSQWGVSPDSIGHAESECAAVDVMVANASTSFDPGSLRLDITIPQVSLSRTARGYVDPARWDAGMTAATLGYTFNANAVSMNSGLNTTTAFTGLEAGLNVGGWRLRGRGSLSWSSTTGSSWQRVGAFAEHDVQRLRSQFTIGDGFTGGELFSSAGYRGANLASDDRMLPDSQVGYAPVVRGTAQTRARVEIRQNDFLIYETTVASGQFEIDDLYATGHSGDLDVRVIETDGTVRSFTVPYAAVPRLLRAGASRYSATVGKLRGTAADMSAPTFAEATYQRGFNNWLTGFAGVQATEDALYRSALVGAAVNTRVGALSWDITGARTQLEDESLSGYSTRLTFSKAIPSTRTNFALAGYRYSTGNYLELADAAAMQVDQGDVWRARARDRLQLSFSQQLGEKGGMLFTSGSRQTYRDGMANNTTFQLGYNNRKGALAYNLGASRTLDGAGRKDDQLFVSLSMPFVGFGARRAPTLSASATTGASAGTSLRMGASGTLGSQDQVNYAVNVSDSDLGGFNADAAIAWRAPYALLTGGYGWSSDAEQVTLSASGGLVAHKGGITLSQRLGETNGVAEVKDAKGATLFDGSHAKVDRRGYVVAADLRPYRLNTIELDPKGMSVNVELETSQLQTVPRAGAVVPLRFNTKAGYPLLVRAERDDGEALPFGAWVTDENGDEIGLVGQGGQLFARRMERAGTLHVRWGDTREDTCVINYELPERSDAKASITEVEAKCL